MAKRTVKPTKNTKSASKNRSVAKTDVTTASTQPQHARFSLPIDPGKRTAFLVGVLVVLAFALLYAGRSYFIAATVNGQPVSRLSVISDLEKQGGKQALSTEVTKLLIEQEAKKKNITVSNADIAAETKKIEDSVSKQQQNLDDLLKAQGMTRNDLKDQLKTKIMLDKLVGKNVTVSNKEIDDYIAKNKESIPPTLTGDAAKSAVKDQLMQQKLNDKIQQLIAQLQKDAKINYLVNY